MKTGIEHSEAKRIDRTQRRWLCKRIYVLELLWPKAFRAGFTVWQQYHQKIIYSQES